MPKAKKTELEDRFYELAEQTIQEAELIECSLPEYLAGLKVMRSALDERIEQVTDELKL